VDNDFVAPVVSLARGTVMYKGDVYQFRRTDNPLHFEILQKGMHIGTATYLPQGLGGSTTADGARPGETLIVPLLAKAWGDAMTGAGRFPR
jgi:hypothetical protein